MRASLGRTRYTGGICALFALLLASCDGLLGTGVNGEPRPDRISLTTSAEVVARGDPIVLTLRNDSGAPVGYNLCVVDFQPRVSGQWSDQTVQYLRVCTGELAILPSGKEVGSGEEVPAMSPGTYRVRTTVELGGERLTVATAPFTVVAP